MLKLKDKNIFVVEDNLQNRVIFKLALVKHGVCVDFERSGQDTIFHLKNSPHIDLIILDLMLRDGISGFDLYDEIRAMPEFAKVPIVAVSAMDPSVAMPKTRNKGFNGFIAKPIDTKLFPTQIAAIFDLKQVWYADERTLK